MAAPLRLPQLALEEPNYAKCEPDQEVPNQDAPGEGVCGVDFDFESIHFLTTHLVEVHY